MRIEKHRTIDLSYADEDDVPRIETESRLTGLVIRVGPVELRIGSAIDEHKDDARRLRKIYR